MDRICPKCNKEYDKGFYAQTGRCSECSAKIRKLLEEDNLTAQNADIRNATPPKPRKYGVISSSSGESVKRRTNSSKTAKNNEKKAAKTQTKMLGADMASDPEMASAATTTVPIPHVPTSKTTKEDTTDQPMDELFFDADFVDDDPSDVDNSDFTTSDEEAALAELDAYNEEPTLAAEDVAPLGEEFQPTENNSVVEENLSAELREKQRITDALVHKKTKHPEIAPQENRKKFSDNDISKDEPEESAASWLQRCIERKREEQSQRAEQKEIEGSDFDSNQDGYYDDTPLKSGVKADVFPKALVIKISATIIGMFGLIAFLIYYA
jgi:hypothetical protein